MYTDRNKTEDVLKKLTHAKSQTKWMGKKITERDNIENIMT